MSYTAFHHFLRGGKPQPETISRLVRWYVATKRGIKGVTAEDVTAATSLLNAYIAEAGTPKAIARRRQQVLALLAAPEAGSD